MDLIGRSVLRGDELVEPAYEIGGDAFDYALNLGSAQFAIFDAMGHGVKAGMATALAVGAYRTSRRRGDDITTAALAVDDALAEEFTDDRYVTACRTRAVAKAEEKTPPLGPASRRPVRVNAPS